jgi:hypothetical protein
MITTWGYGGYNIVTSGWGEGLYEVAPPVELTYLGARISLLEIITAQLQTTTPDLATKLELSQVIEETWDPLLSLNGRLSSLEDRVEKLRRQVTILLRSRSN